MGDAKQDDRPWAGEGVVTEIEDEPSYCVVHIDSVRPKLKWPRKVNVFHDQPELAVARAAHTSGQLVAYRIEKNAKGYRDLTELVPKNGSSPTGRPSGPAVSPEAPADPDGGRAVPNTEPSRVDSNGFLACVGMVDLAVETLVACGQEVTAAAIRPLASAMLHAADEAQQSQAGHVDRAAHGHTRARGAVRTALKLVPYSGDPDDGWRDRLTKAAARLLSIAADLDRGGL